MTRRIVGALLAATLWALSLVAVISFSNASTQGVSGRTTHTAASEYFGSVDQMLRALAEYQGPFAM